MRKGRYKNGTPDILLWLKENKKFDQYLSISDLVKEIHSQLHFSPEIITESILDFYCNYKEFVSLERTSEIFITGNTRGGRVEKRRLRFFPMRNGSYVSHLILRKPISDF